MLTPREAEILQHVAAGRTNGEIGKQLFISTKTVSVHVSNILGKLGASGRTEAAAIARRRRAASTDALTGSPRRDACLPPRATLDCRQWWSRALLVRRTARSHHAVAGSARPRSGHPNRRIHDHDTRRPQRPARGQRPDAPRAPTRLRRRTGGDADGTDGGDTDGTDGGDADGTDGDGTDGTDGDASDGDGTDGTAL